MGNIFQTMTTYIMKYYYPVIFEDPEDLDKSQEYFDGVIGKINGFKPSDVYAKKPKKKKDNLEVKDVSCKMLSFLSDLIKNLYTERKQKIRCAPRNYRTAIENWRKGKNDMIGYTIWTEKERDALTAQSNSAQAESNTKKRNQSVATQKTAEKESVVDNKIPSNHVVDFLSALNLRYDCFSKLGSSFKEHIENVSKFLAELTSRTSTASPVIFYSRSLNDIALMYCTYMRYTNEDFVELARRLDKAKLGIKENKDDNNSNISNENNNENNTENDSNKNIYYSSVAIENHVIENIFNRYFRNEEWEKIKKPEDKDDFATRGEKALDDLVIYIEDHRDYFFSNVPFSKLGKMIDKLTKDNEYYKDIFLNNEVGEFLYDLYVNNKLHIVENKKREREPLIRKAKKDYSYTLYEILRNAVYDSDPEHAKVDVRKKDGGEVRFDTFETVFNLLVGDDVKAYISNSIILLRYSIIVNLIYKYTNCKHHGRPNENESENENGKNGGLYGNKNLIENINLTMDELGLVRLHGIHRDKAHVDWCLYEYVNRIDDKVRQEAEKQKGEKHECE